MQQQRELKNEYEPVPFKLTLDYIRENVKSDF